MYTFQHPKDRCSCQQWQKGETEVQSPRSRGWEGEAEYPPAGAVSMEVNMKFIVILAPQGLVIPALLALSRWGKPWEMPQPVHGSVVDNP